MTFFKKIQQTLEMIKFSHSIFALPFALSSLLLATAGRPSFMLLIKVIACMVFARNAAMSFNRYVDRAIDAKNPRTANRHLPKKLISPRFVLGFFFINSLAFIATTALLNPLSFYLSFVALGVICGYSTTKRFTHYTQLALGISLGISPIAAWIAATGEITPLPMLMGLGVCFWVAGFDILYATQDYVVDCQQGIKSIVVRFGIPRALVLSKIFHAMSWVTFGALGVLFDLGIFYGVAIIVIGFILAYQHWIVRDLSKINIAFFNLNGMVGVFFFLGVLAIFM